MISPEQTPDSGARPQDEITRSGNPRKPEGKDGRLMLEHMNDSHAALTSWALGYWSVKPGDVILDIGCGGGATLRRLAEKVTTGHLTGVDYSDVSVAETSALNAEDIASGKMDVVRASVEKLPFEDGTFDKIITVESFYFWPDPVENLKEVRRVLKDGGQFLLVSDIYKKPGLSEKILRNIEAYNLRNPSPEEFEQYFRKARLSRCLIHTCPGHDWICVEGSRMDSPDIFFG